MVAASTKTRRVIRRAVAEPCIAVDRVGFKLVSQRVIDVSEEGMRLSVDKALPRGRSIRVTFRAPTGQWMTVDTVVKRVEHGRRDGEHGVCLGVEFTRIDQREELRAKLIGIPPPIPTRALRVKPTRAPSATPTLRVTPITAHAA